jgi:2-phosphosulfolactate phosphatase
MLISVYGGREGARRAAAAGQVTIVVDALRASTTTASLLHYGVQRLIVVEQVDEALAEARLYPGALLAGERECVRIEGFDLGNSPLQAPLSPTPETVIFTSSNMSRCCVGAAQAPAVLLGTLVTLTATANLALELAQQLGRDVQLVPAGAVVDEFKLVREDYIASGALIEALLRHSKGTAQIHGDAANMALDSYQGALATGLTTAFEQTDNGRALAALGFAEDVRFASRVDVFAVVPRVIETHALPSGGVAAVLAAGRQ